MAVTRRRTLLLSALTPGAALLALPGRPLLAQPAPVLLRITGRLDGGRSEVSFTLEALEALGQEDLVTTTPWTPGPQRFSGVPLRRVLEAAGARGTLLKATALNDYEVRLPYEDATRHGAFLATRLDGQLLRVRDRGPLWILYPWSSRQELNTATYRERSIWQLRQIEVV